MPILPVAFHGFDEKTKDGKVEDQDRCEGGKGDPEGGRTQEGDQEQKRHEAQEEPPGTVLPSGSGIAFYAGPVVVHGRSSRLEEKHFTFSK